MNIIFYYYFKYLLIVWLIGNTINKLRNKIKQILYVYIYKE